MPIYIRRRSRARGLSLSLKNNNKVCSEPIVELPDRSNISYLLWPRWISQDRGSRISLRYANVTCINQLSCHKRRNGDTIQDDAEEKTKRATRMPSAKEWEREGEGGKWLEKRSFVNLFSCNGVGRDARGEPVGSLCKICINIHGARTVDKIDCALASFCL